MTYVERYSVDIGEWEFGGFKSAIDFYLNEKLNLNNVLIFTKYYTYYHECRLARQGKAGSDAEKFAMNKRIFNKPIVDARALFGFLVGHLGTRTAVDPVTKDDALWRLVEFLTRPAVTQLTAFGESDALADKDLAQYLGNRFAGK